MNRLNLLNRFLRLHKLQLFPINDGGCDDVLSHCPNRDEHDYDGDDDLHVHVHVHGDDDDHDHYRGGGHINLVDCDDHDENQVLVRFQGDLIV